jgi:hypothetical protein
MKSLYIKSLVLVLVTAATVGCKKQLNVMPTDKQVDENLILDTKSALTVLNGVYYRFADAGADNNEVPSIKWSQTHEAIPSELSGLVINGSGEDGLGNFSLDKTNFAVADKWTYAYNLVNAANGFLKNVEPVNTIPDATKRQMKAEAKFLRAFGNADLLFYFGQYYNVNSKFGIILRNEFVTSDNLSIARTSVAESYAAILADLDAAIPDLPPLNTQKFYTNAATAKLLKARVLIHRGSAGDYAQVISLTDDIIKNSPFELEGNTKDIFLTKGFTSKEVMLGLQPFPTENYKYQQNQYYTQYPGSPALKELLLNDPRASWVYKTVVKRGEPVNMLTKYYSGDPVAINLTPLSIYSYAFRLSEAYLLQSEAICLSGGNVTTAKTLLKTVMGHAGIADFTEVDAVQTPEALRVLIAKEVMKNFVSENGIDWLTLHRLPFQTVQELRPDIKSLNSLILPIPDAEIKSNGKIEPNPGY